MIIGLIGLINSGKGTVATQLVQEYDFRQDSFAASLKDACAVIFDWPRHMLEGDTKESREWREIVDPWWSEKLNMPNFSPRLALQVVGTEALRNNFNQDLWFLTLQNRIRKNPNQHVVISDVRFPNEIKFIQEQKGILVKVNRGPLPVWYETALMANKGNSIAKEVMNKTYSGAHLSEWAWVGTKVTAEVQNDGSVDDLKLQIRNIINEIL
jgi:hypothetical protein